VKEDGRTILDPTDEPTTSPLLTASSIPAKKAITLPRKTLIVVPPTEYTRRTTNSGGYIPYKMLLNEINSVAALKSAKEKERVVPVKVLRSSTI
jgi:hypothetical protein